MHHLPFAVPYKIATLNSPKMPDYGGGRSYYNCMTQNTSNTQLCLKCFPGYFLVSNENMRYAGKVPNAWHMQGSLTPVDIVGNLNQIQCISFCPTGTFPSVVVDEVARDITSQTCTACDPSCLTCIDAGSSGCTSCRLNEYLTVTNLNYSSGTCSQKTSNSGTNIQIQVTGTRTSDNSVIQQASN